MNKEQEILFKKYRKEYLKIQSLQEDQLNQYLNDLNTQIDNNTYVLDKDERTANLVINNLITISLGFFVGSLIVNNTNVLYKSRNYALDLIKPLNSFSANTSIESNFQKLLSSYYGENLLKRRLPNSDITVGKMIKTIEGNALKTTQRIIKVGVDEGKSAKQIASEIKNFIKKDDRKKWVSPFEWYRQANGFKVNRQPILDRRGGSLDYQTMRIARTEINYSWRQSTVLMHKDNPYMQGWEWRLSASHKEIDICDDYANASPYTDYRDIPDSHPNCLCSLVPIVKLPDETSVA